MYRAEEGEESRPRTTASAAHPPRVLIVGEDAEMRCTLRAFLHGEGFAVVEAGDGAEALARARDGEYAGVLLDMAGGSDVSHLLPRILDLTAAAPVVLTTAVPGRPTLRRALALGAAGVLVKPFGLDDLVQLLREVRSGRSARTQAAWSGEPRDDHDGVVVPGR
jgi:CheY-like chemotaxis protein